MRSVIIIASNTFREIIRDRVLVGIAVFSLLLLGLSLALGELSFSEQARISADFGFAGIQIGSAVLAIFVGSTLVAREIEKQTILTLLARPISRSQFLLGKFAGLSLVILAVVAGLAVILGALVLFLGMKIVPAFFVALFGIYLEALVLVALALLFGSFARPMTTVAFTVAIFLIGHWVSSMHHFVEKSNSMPFRLFGKALTWIVPDLERFNWRAAPVYGLEVPLKELVQSTFFAAGWLLVLLSLTMIIFRRRDFV